MNENEKHQEFIDNLVGKSEKEQLNSILAEARKILNQDPGGTKFYAQYLIEHFNSDIHTCHGKMLMAEALFELGHYNESYDYCRQCAVLNEKLNYPLAKGVIENRLGLSQWRKGDLEKALESLFSALRYWTEQRSIEQIADVENNIGLIYWDLSMTEEALRHYRKSLEMKTELEDEKGIATLNNNIAGIYYKKGDLATALEFIDPVIEFFHKAGRYRELAQVVNNKAILLIELGELEKAEEILNKTYSKAVERNYRIEQIVLLTTLGSLEAKRNRTQIADDYFEKAIAIGRDIDSKELVRTTLTHQARFYEKIGDHKNALQKFKEMSQIKDEIFHEQLGNKIAELETKFDTEKKEKEKEIYRLKNIELAQKNDEIHQQKVEIENTLHKLQIAQQEIIDLERKASAMAMAVTANHEINQPLMVIQGNMDMLQMSLDTESMDSHNRQYFKKIDESINRIRDILDKFKNRIPARFTAYSSDTEMVEFDEDSKIENEKDSID